MGSVEIIDRLCEITTVQSDLIRELYSLVEQSEIVNDEMRKVFEYKCKDIDDKLDIAEYYNRDIVR